MSKRKNIDDTNLQKCEKKITELVATIDKVEDEKLVVENQLKKLLLITIT